LGTKQSSSLPNVNYVPRLDCPTKNLSENAQVFWLCQLVRGRERK